MTLESDISVEEALYELAQHGFFDARVRSYNGRRYIVDGCGDDEYIARLNEDGTVSGADILDWLGY